MEKFAVGITIGAALTSAFTATIATGQQKIQKLSASVKSLSGQKMAVAEVRKYQNALVELTAKGRKLNGRSREFSRELTETKAKLQAAASQVRGYGLDMGRLAEEEKRLDAAMKRTNTAIAARTRLRQNKGRRAELRSSMFDAAAPAVAAAAPVMEAIKFESSMADVRKVVNFPTPKAFKQMGDDILRLSTRIPFAASGLSDIIAAAGQSGIAKSRSELLQFAEDAAKMGVAFDIGAADAGKMMADWRAGMNLDQTQAVSLANAVNHLSNNMNAQAGALGEVLRRQGAVAKASGLTAVQTASLSAALLSSGAGPERAATALKNLTGALTKGSAATKAQRDAFSALGFDAEEVAASMQSDAQGTIRSVFQALSEAPVEQQSALLTQLFGEESKGAIAPLLANMGNLDKAFSLTADKTKYAGSMQAEFSQRAATTANNLTLLRNRVSRAAVSLGSVLLPALNALIMPIGAVFDGVSWLAAKFPTLTTVVVTVAAVLMALPVATLAVKYGMTLLSDGVSMAKIVFSGLGSILDITKIRLIAMSVAQKAAAIGSRVLAAGQVALGAAMEIGLGPIGLIIGAVGLLAAAAFWVVRNWGRIGPFFSRMWTGVKHFFSAGVQGVKTAFLKFTPLGWIVQAFGKVTQFLHGINWSGSGMAIVKTLAKGMLSVAAMPVKAIKGVLAKVRRYLPFSDAKEGPLSQLTKSGRSILTTIGTGLAKGESPFKALFHSVFEGLTPKVGHGGGGILGGLAGMLINPAGALLSGMGGQPDIIIHQTNNFRGGDRESLSQALDASNRRLVQLIKDVIRDADHGERRESFGGARIA